MQNLGNSAGSGLTEDLLSRRLRIVDHYLTPMEDGALQIHTATRSAILRGGAVQRVLPQLVQLLDGTRKNPDILAEFSSDRSHAEACLRLLSQKGMIFSEEEAEQSETLEVREKEFVQFLGRRGDGREAYRNIRKSHVAVILADPQLQPVADSVAGIGVRRVSVIATEPLTPIAQLDAAIGTEQNLSHASLSEFPTTATAWAAWAQSFAQAPDMLVVALSGPVIFHPWLDALNSFALEHSIPWTIVAVLNEQEIHIGPTIRPHLTACYKCFEFRLKSNLANLGVYTALERYVREGGKTKSFGIVSTVAQMAGVLLAMEVTRVFHPHDAALSSGKQFVFNTATYSGSFHPVLKLPRCPACSQARNQPMQRIWA
jgi:bacteriocin biosynthesis cyclodehydratase domain-containing protein